MARRGGRPRPAVGAAGDGGPGRERPAQPARRELQRLLRHAPALNAGDYRGFPSSPTCSCAGSSTPPSLVRQRRVAEGRPDPAADPAAFGLWVADVERPRPRTVAATRSTSSRRAGSAGDGCPGRSERTAPSHRGLAAQGGRQAATAVGAAASPCACAARASRLPGRRLRRASSWASAPSRCGPPRSIPRVAGPRLVLGATEGRSQARSRVSAGCARRLRAWSADDAANATSAAPQRAARSCEGRGDYLRCMARDTGLPRADAQFDFNRARRRRALARLSARLRGEPGDVNHILPFEEVVPGARQARRAPPRPGADHARLDRRHR